MQFWLAATILIYSLVVTKLESISHLGSFQQEHESLNGMKITDSDVAHKLYQAMREIYYDVQSYHMELRRVSRNVGPLMNT